MTRRVVDTLVIEDDSQLQDAIVTSLALAGFEALGLSSAESADEWLDSHQPSCIILDLNLPGQDGAEWLSHFAEIEHTGIIVVTGRSDHATRLRCLDAGADGFLVKPFEPEELVLMVTNLIRRLKSTQQWVIDGLSWELAPPGGQGIRLTASEMIIMMRLAETPGMPVARADVVTALGRDWMTYDPRRLEVMMRRLRGKVETATNQKMPIRTVRGIGYSFTAPIYLKSYPVGNLVSAPSD